MISPSFRPSFASHAASVALREQLHLVGRQVVLRLQQHVLEDERAADLHRRAGGGIAGDDAVEVGRITLHFHQRLAAAVRAAVEVGVRRRLAEEGGRQLLAGDRRDVRAAMAVVDLLGAVRAPGRIARLVAGVGGRRGVAARQARVEVPDRAAEAADADEVELAVPGVGQAEPEVHLVAGHGDVAVDAAMLRHVLGRRDDRRRRDRRAFRRLGLDRRDGALGGRDAPVLCDARRA